MDFTLYHPALLALTILCLSILVQSFVMPIFAFTEKGGQKPGRVVGGPDQFSFRVLRTYLNSTETLPAFMGALVVAIIVGVDPLWVNRLAGIFVLFRLFFWAVYYSKLGIATPGCFVIASIANIILAVITVLALI